MNKSPLRYPGGKTRACKVLQKIIDEHFDMKSFDTIVSPFFGGGSFEFHIQNKYGLKILANDKFTPLYNFWNICKTQQKELCDELYNYLNNSENEFAVDKDLFYEMRNTILDDEPLNQAIKYFVINRCSFSGATLSGGFSYEASKKRFTTSSIDRVKKLNLEKFEIYNRDFQDFIYENPSSKTSFMFLDPPYYLEKGSKLYGNNGDMHEKFDHEKLHQCVKDKKNWIMTYNDCDFIRKLYSQHKIIDTNWSYGMNASKKSSEIVIFFNINK